MAVRLHSKVAHRELLCRVGRGRSGGGYRQVVLKVAYIDNNETRQVLKLGSRSTFERPPYAIAPILQEFLDNSNNNAN